MSLSVSHRDDEGKTPLHHAARAGHEDLVRQYLEVGSPINAKDMDRETPLFAAVSSGRTETVKILLQWGANPHIEVYTLRTGPLEEDEELDIETPITEAVRHGHLDILKLLLDVGASTGPDITYFVYFYASKSALFMLLMADVQIPDDVVNNILTR